MNALRVAVLAVLLCAFQFPPTQIASWNPSIVQLEGCTGFIVAKNYVVTAAHCVEGQDVVKVRLRYNGGFSYFDVIARSFDLDKFLDYAVLKGDTTNHPSLDVIEDFSEIDVPVRVYGHPKGTDQQYRVTGWLNKVACLPMQSEPSCKYSAAINIYHGNSGSPMVNRDGAIIGIISTLREYYPFGSQRYIPYAEAVSIAPAMEAIRKDMVK